MHRDLGIDTDFVPEDEWARRFPWLNRDGVGAIVFERSSGYADPVQTTEAFVASFARAGGEFRPRTPVRALLREGDRVTGVLLDDGPVSAGGVINAAGPWARFLAESAGLDLPLRAVREQDAIWEVRPGRPLPARAFPARETNVSERQMVKTLAIAVARHLERPEAEIIAIFEQAVATLHAPAAK